MNNNLNSIRFADEFEKELYRLSKKYRHIKKDIKPIIDELEQGNLSGNRLSGFGSDIYIYKVRLKNSNVKKGKSGGYRLIYLVESTKNSILLLTIYSKSEQADIINKELKSIIQEFYED